MSGKFKSIRVIGSGLAFATAILLPYPTAQASSTATVAAATSTATVVQTITLTESTPLAFGSVAAGDGTRTIASNAAPAFSGSTRGSFAVTGAAALTYRVAAIGNITLTSGGNTMTVSNITGTCNGRTNVSLTAGTTACALAGSADTLYIGGLLTIGGAQAAGSYTGTYAVTVTYE